MAVASIKPADIEVAIAMDDEDEAALHIQKIAGIEDGGIAAQAFSGFDWKNANEDERRERTKAWLQLERTYEDGGNG